MMTKSLLCAALAAAVLVAQPAAQDIEYGVTATVEEGVDFASFRTYSWHVSYPSQRPSVDAQIVAAVDRELAALGLKKVDAGAGDVRVTYGALARTDIDLAAPRTAEGGIAQQTVGSLVVALLDKTAPRQLLRLRADKPIDVPVEELGPVIDAVVGELFERYPTRTPPR